MSLIQQRDTSVSIVAACNALGVSRATLYRARRPASARVSRPRPPSPRRLSDGERQRLLDCLHSPEFADQPPAAAIQALAQTYITFALTETHRWLAIYQHRMPEGQPVPESLTDKVAGMFALAQQQLARLCPRRSPQDIALAARALWSGVHGICILGFDQKLEMAGGRPIQEVTRSLLDHYLAGFTQA